MPSRLPSIAAVLVLLIAGSSACVPGAGGSDGAVSPATVRTDWDLVHRTDGPPVAIDVGQLSTADDGWAAHDVVLRGAQIEYVVDLALPSRRFEAIERELVPVDPGNSTEPVRLGFDGRVKLEVVVPDELAPGRHTFSLIVPTWINRAEPGGEPDDDIVITLGYTVQDATDRRAVEGFCEDAVPLTDGRRPSIQDLDRLSVLAAGELVDELDDGEVDRLSVAIGRLRQDLAAFESGIGEEFSTSEVNDIIGSICNVDMLSESVES